MTTQGRPLGRALSGALLAACMMAAPSAADAGELHLNNGSEGAYRVQVRSWQEIPFRTVIRQQFDFSCGSAAAATLLSHHYGRPTAEAQVFAAMWEKGDQEKIRKVGFSMLDIKDYLDGIGYRTEGFRLSVDQLRQVARPGLVILDIKGYKHFVVVKGVEGDRVLVGDPMLGLGQYSMKEFQSYWNGIFLAVVSSPQKERPTFNLASDWTPWAKAPLQDGVPDRPIYQLTDHLPAVYQITNEIQLDLRNPGGS